MVKTQKIPKGFSDEAQFEKYQKMIEARREGGRKRWAKVSKEKRSEAMKEISVKGVEARRKK